MIVTTINVNGIRAAIRQRSEANLGLLPWPAETKADVVCLQETRADDEQLADGPPRKLGVPPGICLGGRRCQGPQRGCGAESAPDP